MAKSSHRKHQDIDPEAGARLAYLGKIRGRGGGERGRGEQGRLELGGKLSRTSQAPSDGEHSRAL